MLGMAFLFRVWSHLPAKSLSKIMELCLKLTVNLRTEVTASCSFGVHVVHFIPPKVFCCLLWVSVLTLLQFCWHDILVLNAWHMVKTFHF